MMIMVDNILGVTVMCSRVPRFYLGVFFFFLDSSLKTLRQAHTHKSQEAGIRSRYFDPHLSSEKARTP